MGISATAPWLAFYGKTPATLDYPRKTMYQMVAEAARRYPSNTAYIFMGKQTRYDAFLKRIDDAARGLVKLGITRGDRVIPVTSLGYRLYCRVWVATMPLRKFVRRVKNRLKRMLHII